MSKLRICHLTVAHSPKDVRIFRKECVALVKAGYDVTLIAPNINDQTSDGVTIKGVTCSQNPLSRFFIGARKIYKKALEQDADIYHFHDIELFRYGVRLKVKGKKVIFDSHEDWLMYVLDISWVPSFLRKLLSFYLKNQYRNYITLFDAVITVSPHILSELKRYTDSVYMVTNYPIIDSKYFKHFNLDNYKNRDKVLFYSGVVSNQEVILKAINHIPELKYNIAGTFFDKYKNELSVFPSWNRVNYLGYLSRQDLDSAFNKALIGITLLHYHANVGFNKGTLGNNKLFDYMMYGLPVICTNFEIWEKMIIKKYNCGICVDPNNVNEVQSAIEYLINNPTIAYEMGQNGQKAIKKEFNWNSQENILLELYRKVSEQG